MELELKTFKKKVLKEKFNGNQRQCAIGLNISPEFLNKIIKQKCKAGTLFLGKLKLYCDKNNLDFNNFIILK